MQQAFQNFCFAITIYLDNTDRVLKSWNLGSKMRNFISQSYKKNCREIVNVELHFLRFFEVGWQPSQEGRGVAKIVSTGWSWVDLGCAVKNLTRAKRAEEKLTNHICTYEAFSSNFANCTLEPRGQKNSSRTVSQLLRELLRSSLNVQKMEATSDLSMSLYRG